MMLMESIFIFIFSIPVTDIVSFFTCHYMFFHSSYCILQASELRSNVTCKIVVFIAGLNHTFKNTFLVLLMKWKY